MFLAVCVLAQLTTILISWPTWQVREQPVNLPWIIGTPQFSCGIALVLSLLLALISPRKYGVAIHLVVLAVAIGMDQFRCQPQILSVAVLMAGCTWTAMRPVSAWFLVSMWAWAGVHKLWSPDWMGHVSYRLLSNHPINSPDLYDVFAVVVAVSEIALAALAWLKPKTAVYLCVAIHVGISLFLLLIRWNYSVIPWNLCSAVIGGWLLWSASARGPRLKLPPLTVGKLAVVVMFLLPIAFYFGGIRHCFAHVLYSGNLPHGLITHQYLVEPMDTWDELRVPFPNVQRTYRDYFAATALPGDKLHVLEPRAGLESHFYVLTPERTLREIELDEFFGSQANHVMGVAHDDPRKLFRLELGGAKLLKRSEDEMIYAIKFEPKLFRPELLQFLDGLPNLEQIQLADCDVQDEDLKFVSGLKKLVGIGLNNTTISDRGLEHLQGLPLLGIVEHENSRITKAGLLKLGL